MHAQHQALLLLAVSSAPLCLSFSLSFLPSTSTSKQSELPHRRPSFVLFDSPTKDDEIPTMDWLTNGLAKKGDGSSNMGNGVSIQDGATDMADDSPFVEEFDQEDGLGEAPVPSTGVSVADEMQRAQADHFFTELVPVSKGLEEGIKVAQLVTSATKGSFEPVRYLVGLSKISRDKPGDMADDDTKRSSSNELVNDFVMIDVPPFSKQLKEDMGHYLAGNNGRLAAILMTSRDCIHYNEAPGMYSIRRADLDKWTKAFPETATVGYRLDIPRDCRELVTQRLDGYGPFALEESDEIGAVKNFTFVESGRPLTYEEWDHDISEDIFAGKATPPDDAEAEEDPDAAQTETDDDLYTPEAIRAREEGKRLLAVYTPGRTYGSVSYVFPEIQLCASGFAIPVEDSRNEENLGLSGTGPALDARGYITTSHAGISRQTESARNLIQNYMDRITVLLPSRGDPVFLDGKTQQRQTLLLDVVAQYEKIGKIYEQLGITSKDEDDLDI